MRNTESKQTNSRKRSEIYREQSAIETMRNKERKAKEAMPETHENLKEKTDMKS